MPTHPPRMILFDYGQTLVAESAYNGIAGHTALLSHAVKNKYGRTAADVQARADELNIELGRRYRETRHLFQVEVPNSMFTAFLYTSMGIELELSPVEIDRIFWDAASPGVPTEGIARFLNDLRRRGIRTGVISNLSYCGAVLKERIDRLIPTHSFEFIIATSEYTFRKPNRHIFDLGLEMADLAPEDVWYVGDNYRCDVLGARGAGIRGFLYTGAMREAVALTELSEAREDAEAVVIPDWAEMEALLESL